MPKSNKSVRKVIRPNKRVKNIGLRQTLRSFKYLPAIAIATFASVLAWQPQSGVTPFHDVLAYATNTSPSGLLSATNTQRANNGVAALASNSLLAAAAQAKAQDMVTKDYWSHVSPDGKQPWSFISAAGYSYTSAGENLAYGFLTSGDTVTGWMNSPSHKANLINSVFKDVGFGIANSENFVGDGQQTVVVAMYGTPQVAGASTSSPTPPSTKKSTTPVAIAPVSEPDPVPAEKTEQETIAVEPTEEAIQTTATAAPSRIERVELLTRGQLAGSVGAVILIVCLFGLLWAVHRGWHFRKYVLAGERFIAHNLHIDLTVLSVIYLGFVLLSTSGAVR